MKTKEFRAHLKIKFPDSPIAVSNVISICAKVEKYHGDLDEHFANDICEKMLYLLTYTANDYRHGKNARHNIPCDGNLQTNSATYKKCVKVYREFSKKESGSLVLVSPAKKILVAGYEQTRIKDENELRLRQVDSCFENEKDLDEFFVMGVTGYSESTIDLKNILYLARQYFKNMEGAWYFRTSKTECYLKIVPSKITESSHLNTYFTDIFYRNQNMIKGLLQSYWDDVLKDSDPEYMSSDDIFLDMRYEEDIRKNITGE